MPRKPDTDLDELLNNWESVYKKGLLTFWLLLFLHERPAYAYGLSEGIADFSQNTLSADENSIYRALNRFQSIGLVSSELRPSSVGPARRYYTLTETGTKLLKQFVRRNVLVFHDPIIKQRLQSLLGNTATLT